MRLPRRDVSAPPEHLYPLRAMGGGRRVPWTVRALGALIGAQLLASGTVLAVRPAPARSAALVRSKPVPATTSTTSEPTTLPPPPSTTSPPTAPPTTTPPLPGDPAARLAGRVNAALGALPSCVIVQDGSTTVYDRSGDLALAPASTQKLLVAAAALDQLGPDYRFVTTVVAPNAPVNGAVDALWLVGSGDPLLATPDYSAYLASQPRSVGTPVTPLAALGDQLAAAGVRSVRDGVHGDASHFNGPQWLPGWKPIYRDEADVPLLSALTVDGGLDHWKPTEVISADPTAAAAGQLNRLLTARGVAAAAGSNQTRPGGAVVLARVSSAPLAEIVASMLRSSDNLAAEMLVKELDSHAGGAGTTEGGLTLVNATAALLGIPTGGLHMGDGSGLDPGDRATCTSLLGALSLGTSRPGFDAINSGLSVAGLNGTLAKRFGGTPLAGHLAAKTGWINCAAAMVGRVDVKRPVRFAFIVNGPCDWDTAEALENRVATAVGTFPD
jgi:D-alanyl-D-alanine carboxypeptidase/D-alanyl-D-alanine-endopeptidase (penicillin-binding protein 4)